jgi:hypothetical protein
MADNVNPRIKAHKISQNIMNAIQRAWAIALIGFENKLIVSMICKFEVN